MGKAADLEAQPASALSSGCVKNVVTALLGMERNSAPAAALDGLLQLLSPPLTLRGGGEEHLVPPPAHNQPAHNKYGAGFQSFSIAALCRWEMGGSSTGLLWFHGAENWTRNKWRGFLLQCGLAQVQPDLKLKRGQLLDGSCAEPRGRGSWGGRL